MLMEPYSPCTNDATELWIHAIASDLPILDHLGVVVASEGENPKESLANAGRLGRTRFEPAGKVTNGAELTRKGESDHLAAERKLAWLG